MHVKHSQVSKIQSHVVCKVFGWLVVFFKQINLCATPNPKLDIFFQEVCW